MVSTSANFAVASTQSYSGATNAYDWVDNTSSNGGGGAADVTTTLTSNSTTVNWQQVHWKVAGAAAAGGALPAVGAAATGYGVRFKLTDTGSTAAAQRIFPAGTWTQFTDIQTSTYALLQNVTYNVCFIWYRVSAAGVIGAELFRMTGTAAQIAQSTEAAPGANVTTGQITLAAGEDLHMEEWIQFSATSVLGSTTNTTIKIAINNNNTRIQLPSPGMRTLYTNSTTDTVPSVSDVAVRVTNQRRINTDASVLSEDNERVTTYNRPNQVETLSVSEDCERITVQQRMIPDSVVSGTDSVGRLIFFPRLTSDSITGTNDLVTRQVIDRRLDTDVLSTSDSLVRFAFFPRLETESIATLSESLKRVATFNRPCTETLTLSELIIRSFRTTRNTIIETLTTSETLTKVITYGRFEFEYPNNVFVDYPVNNKPYKYIAGVVYLDEASTTPYTATALTVVLVRTSDGFQCQSTTTSTVDGSYSFVRDRYDPNTYAVECPTQLVQDGTQNGTYRQDITADTLVPV